MLYMNNCFYGRLQTHSSHSNAQLYENQSTIEDDFVVVLGGTKGNAFAVSVRDTDLGAVISIAPVGNPDVLFICIILRNGNRNL